MKTKLIATLAILLIASIALSCFVALSAATSGSNNGKSADAHKKYSSFTFVTATGTAVNSDGEEVNIAIEIEGKANGKTKTVFHMRTQGGDVGVATFDTFSAVKGQGVIVNKNDFIHLNLMLSNSYYGGRNTVWILRGTADDLQEDSVTVHLESRRVILPMEGYPQLTNLKLDGTVTFS